jgi:hypothetical protein
MMKYYAIVRESAGHLAAAAERTVEALRAGRIEQEPAFTDRMLGRIEEAMEGYEIKGIRWTAKTLTDRGRGAQETEYGADFVGVLSIRLPDYSVDKGFLAQAKLIEPDGYFPPAEYRRLADQCNDMLNVTPSAYVFLYSRHGISIVPAIAVVSSSHCNPHNLYRRSAARFYEEHFESFFGDRRIRVPNIDALEALRHEGRSRASLFLGAKTVYEHYVD